MIAPTGKSAETQSAFNGREDATREALEVLRTKTATEIDSSTPERPPHVKLFQEVP